MASAISAGRANVPTTFNRITCAFYHCAARGSLIARPTSPDPARFSALYLLLRQIQGPRQERHHRIEPPAQGRARLLDSAKIATMQVDQSAFVNIISQMANHRPEQLYAANKTANPYDELNFQVIDRSTDLQVYPDHLLLTLDAPNGGKSRTRIMNFMLEENPDLFMLWQSGDNISNLLPRPQCRQSLCADHDPRGRRPGSGPKRGDPQVL